MDIYIKEWSNKTATLITQDGQYLFTFNCIESALTACRDWYGITAKYVIPNTAETTETLLHHYTLQQ